MKIALSYLVGLLSGLLALAWWRSTEVGGQEPKVSESRREKSVMEATPRSATNSRAAASPSDASLHSLTETKKRSEQFELLSGILGRLKPGEFGAALDRIKQLPLSIAESRRLSNLVFTKWAEVDPLGATAHFSQLSSVDQVANVDALAIAWAAYDPQAAMTWAQGLPPSAVRGAAVAQALTKVAEVDIEGALATLKTLDRNTARLASAQLYADWAERDPRAAVGSVLSLAETGNVGNAAVASVAARWAKADPVEALKWLSENPIATPYATNFATSLVMAASGVDPEGTVATLMRLPSGDAGNQMRSAIAMQSWLDMDPASAQRWFSNQSNDVQTQLLLTSRRSLTDAAGAQAWLPLAAGLSDPVTRAGVIQALVTKWASVQPEAALLYASNIQDPALGGKLLASATQGMANAYPELAFKTALTLPDNKEKQDTLAKAAAVWSIQNPAQASANIAALPDTPARTQMLQSAALTWALSNPQAASQWYQAMDSTPVRDTILAAMATTLSKSNYALAISNAQAIGDPSLKQTTTARVSGLQTGPNKSGGK